MTNLKRRYYFCIYIVCFVTMVTTFTGNRDGKREEWVGESRGGKPNKERKWGIERSVIRSTSGFGDEKRG